MILWIGLEILLGQLNWDFVVQNNLTHIFGNWHLINLEDLNLDYTFLLHMVSYAPAG